MKLAKIFCMMMLGLLMAVPAMGVTVPGDAQSENLAVGSGFFLVSEKTGVTGEDLRVFYHRPAGWKGDGPVLIVMHGLNRNAADYLAHWRQHAEDYQVLLLCPEMTEKKYPGTRYYNLGNMVDRADASGVLQPQDEWVFPVIDRVFDQVGKRAGATRKGFILYGHSAGAQFVHRYLLFSEQTRAERIISANAGWYTMPNETIAFPYGLDNLHLPPAQLARAFARPVTVLLGEKDIDPNHKVLRRDKETDQQGLYRLARGQTFFRTAQEKAQTLGVPFHWQLLTVPGVGHSDAGMSQTAIRVIVGPL